MWQSSIITLSGCDNLWATRAGLCPFSASVVGPRPEGFYAASADTSKKALEFPRHRGHLGTDA